VVFGADGQEKEKNDAVTYKDKAKAGHHSTHQATTADPPPSVAGLVPPPARGGNKREKTGWGLGAWGISP